MIARYEGDLFDSICSVNGEEQLRRFLADAGRCRVELKVTQNRVSMISIMFLREGHVKIRLHNAFLNAPQEIHDALAQYLRTRRQSVWQKISDYARRITIAPVVDQKPPRPLIARGQVHDLAAIAKEVNRRFFNGCVKCQVGWGGGRPQTRRRSRSRSIRYGSWSEATRVVRIHPLLDDRRVPRAFVAYIIFHEMLHAVIPSEEREGRRIDHGRLFRQQEARYPEIERMKQLSVSLITVLLKR